MDFDLSPMAKDLQARLVEFMADKVVPAEAVFASQLADGGDPHLTPPVMEDLKAEARRRGLWNLFLPYKTEWTDGLSNCDYAPLAEIMGRSHLAPEACNCSAPDTANMEILSLFGSEEQKQRWLGPLLAGRIRSCFSMTEPDVASSDATNISCAITADGDGYVVNGRKWWTSGAMSPRCQVAIVMGRTNPEAPAHRQQSMVLVPLDTPGVDIVRNLTVFGYVDTEGHAEIQYSDVRVPRSNLLGEEGGGFAIAQARLGPGRVHHCMRALGAAERALELMCRRALERSAFGRPLAEQGVVQTWIADARIAVDQARLYTLYAAWLMDTAGNQAARREISGIKVAAIDAATQVVDRAIQTFGAAGVGPDTPLPLMYAHLRALHFADGPDEVHRRSIAQRELRRWQP
ncbi:MAG TPA: acyl-CoA dehydrogenase family protein [Acidimicrobiales bacterium]|jgi:acyl-CoA dehydrogenase|nr:acyl-CoA dehydrogenase family protein [Acidimicrobiales bacterium]